ncbi:unnamed protein product [Phyllotreta striolata]|uniref:Glucose-methanol-choline oxidoreductase N-terminal domain-containing protein n=1 Tax=Phyllotreta striolata TaxID=444603 RepID=A0A9N9TQJ2_PHYSR|nr:unnamed protein product [Phyllotreta striolata]
MLRLSVILVLNIFLVTFSDSQETPGNFFSWIPEELRDFISDVTANSVISLTSFINSLVRFYEENVEQLDDFLWDTTEDPKTEYDFIVVGAGSAGSVVANRLSELPWSVVVLEAGQPETSFVDIPLLAVGFQGGQYDWGYVAEPQENACWGLEDHRMPFPRGKALGGTSVLNYMIYSRGNEIDYNELAKRGNPGWSYEDVLPYFMKSENATDLSYAEWMYHGEGGPLTVEDTFQSAVVGAMMAGGDEIGLPTIDYNAPTHRYGVSPIQSTTRRGRRLSAGRAFLSPVSKRDNLDIVIDALVTKILIDEKKKEAVGVMYEKDGIVYTIKAKKEVIICAGAINSPQLLMLSGVGPQKHLKDLGVPVVKHLPGVGRNLKDHISFYGLNYKVDFDWNQTPLAYLTSLDDFIREGRGPFSTLGGVEGLGLIRTNYSSYLPDAPDIEILFVRGYIGTDRETFTKEAFRLTDDVYDRSFRPLEGAPVWCLIPMLLHPMSTGEVKLRSGDPHDPPLIYGNYYSDKHGVDVKRMIAAIRRVREFEDTAAFRSNGARLSEIPVFGCDPYQFDSDLYWECALKTVSVTMYHPMGTCKMGPKKDKMAVVDNRLRVHGVKNLRVADASVFPWVSGHTNAPAIMVGEKVSDMIKADHQ